ncbi:hypothetical protein M406DRAFT_54234, partial [Cryphonectria parasitica EP155]
MCLDAPIIKSSVIQHCLMYRRHEIFFFLPLWVYITKNLCSRTDTRRSSFSSTLAPSLISP